MTDQLVQGTVSALKALRDQHVKRLNDNPDYQAIQALDEAIDKLASRNQPAENQPEGRFVGRHYTRDAAPDDVSPRISQPAAARQAILSCGRPLSTQELLNELDRMKVHVGGKDPRGNLVSVLSSRADFKSVPWGERKAWWVSDQPVPKEGEI